jgi:hypothetical protein
MFRIYVLALACFLVAGLAAVTLERTVASAGRTEAVGAPRTARPEARCAAQRERRYVRCSTPS